jgi:hypothetical protein
MRIVRDTPPGRALAARREYYSRDAGITDRGEANKKMPLAEADA